MAMLETWVDIVVKLGLPTALVLILLFLIVRYINKKDKQVREDTKEQISILRAENKEDKKIFNKSVECFQNAVEEFKKEQQETNSIKCDITEMKSDLLIIKTKIEK